MPERLAEIAARLRAATKGDWNAKPSADGALWADIGESDAPYISVPLAGRRAIAPTEQSIAASAANWDLIKHAPTDLRYLLEISSAATALLTALQANAERYQPGDAGEAESWYVQGGVMAWVDGEPPEPNPYGGSAPVYAALTALAEALGWSPPES